MDIAALEQEVNSDRFKHKRNRLQQDIDDLRKEKSRLRGLLSVPIIEKVTKEGVTEIQRVDANMVENMLGKIDDEINKALVDLNPFEEKEVQLSDKKARLAMLETLFNEQLSINGVTKTIREWLEEYARQTSISNASSESGSEQMKLEEVRSELNQVQGLIRYYDEGELNARNGRIAEMGNLSPRDIVTNDLLLTIESTNPPLNEILGEIKNLQEKKQFIFVLIQAFGEDLVIPDDPNSEAVNGVIALLKAIKAISSQDTKIVKPIRRTEHLDKLLEKLVHQILKEKKPLDNNKQIVNNSNNN